MSPPHDGAEGRNGPSPDQLEGLLSLAESIDKTVRDLEFRVGLGRAMEFVVISAFTFSGILLSEPGSAAIFTAAGGLLLIFGELLLVRRIALGLRSERRALEEALSVTAEVLSASRNQGWTPLQVVEFRIRMSRLDAHRGLSATPLGRFLSP